ncbi:MAG: V4R domain-containing protein [Candidatus Helarchaeota archaeon]
MLKNVEKFGLKTLDALLGGGIAPGSSVLMVSDHPGTRKQFFSLHFAEEILNSEKDNSHVFNVVYSYPLHQVIELYPDPIIKKALKEKKYTIVNCYGITTYHDEFKDLSIVHLENANDINKLRYIIGTLREEQPPDSRIRWIFDDITNMVITIGSEDRVLQFLRDAFHILKTYGDLALFFVDRTPHSPKFVSSLESMVETVINLTVKDISSVLVPHLRCVKNRFFGEELLSHEVPYTFHHGKILMKSEIFDNFELMKKNLVLQNDGRLELFGTDYIIVTKEGLIKELKAFYNSVEYDSYRKILFENGSEIGKKIYQNFMTKIHTSSNTVFPDISKLFNSLGFGKIKINKLDLEKGIAIIHGEDLFHFKGANRPIHSELAGIFAGASESISGEPWEFIESRCIATGDEFCEFLGGPLRELAPLSQDITNIKNDLEVSRDGELSLRGTRILLMPRGTLLNIVEAVEDITDKDTTTEILYHAGERMAMQFCNILSSRYGLKGVGMIRAYAQIISTRGWGLVELKDIDIEKGTMRAVVKKSLIGSGRKVETDPVDYIPAGVFAGIMEYITKMKLVCEEIKCVAKGDNYCEFIVRPYETTSKTVL